MNYNQYSPGAFDWALGEWGYGPNTTNDTAKYCCCGPQTEIFCDFNPINFIFTEEAVDQSCEVVDDGEGTVYCY